MNDHPHSLNGTVPHDDDTAETTEAKLPPEDLNGRAQHDTFGDESSDKPSGVRRIRAGRVVAAAAGVGLVACLALGYGLTPPTREQKPTAVKIDIRKQQGELPSPPALSMSADMNYATATQPPKVKPSTPAPIGYATLTADGDESEQPAAGGGEDEAVAEMRRQHAALRDELAAAQAQLAEQMEQTRQEMQAHQERQQAALDAPSAST